MYIAVPNCQKGRTDQIGNNRKGDGRNQVHRAKREIENQEKKPNKKKKQRKGKKAGKRERRVRKNKEILERN